MVSYRFAPGRVNRDSWVHDENNSGGRIVGEASHAIDACTAITDSVPVRVFAESIGAQRGCETTDDSVFVTLRHENGSVSNISYQTRGDRSFRSERIEVFGEDRTAIINDWKTIQLWSGGRCSTFNAERDKGHHDELTAFV